MEAVILGHDPHVLVVTETWLHDEVDDNDVFPTDYQVFRRDRSTRGGGIAVLVKHNIQAFLSRQIDDHESITLKLYYRGRSILLFAVYRPPDSPPHFLATLSEHMATFSHEKIFLVGDFNLPGIDWEGFLPMPVSGTHVSFLFDVMLTLNLQQVVNQPTRVQGSSSSILDLVFVSRSLDNFVVTVQHGLSDHKMVSFSCLIDVVDCITVAETVSVKDYSRARDESILDYLELCLDKFTGSDTCELWSEFKKICTYCLDYFIPNRIKKTSKQNPWLTREILHLKRKIKRLKRARAGVGAIQATQSALSLAVGSAKRQYFQHTLPNFISTAPDKFWRFLSKKKQSLNRMIQDSTVLTDKKQIAQQFNRYFTSVFSQKNTTAPSYTSCSQTQTDIVSQPGVFAMLLNLKTKATPGPDNISNIFLRRYAEMLSHFLVVIFRSSLNAGVLPFEWKIGRVVPVLKKGDSAFFCNYRPISLTSSCCKMLEHIIATYITAFLNDNSVLSAFQHGFRKGLSTVTQLTSVVHSFAQVLDKSGQIDVIFIDFCKAFDLVPHCKLLYKLESIGLPPFLINWICAYLTNRVQFVSVDGHNSDELPVTSGVPQGSVLGPLLFLIYVNDLPDIIPDSVQIRLFADDCVLFKEIANHDDQRLLNSSLHSVIEWCNQWGMQLNPDKTVYMKITNKRNSLSFPYHLPARPLSEVNECKYLGVTITNNLSWNKHVKNVCSSAFRKLCFLRHKLRHAPSNVRLLAYTSLIRPKLEYACSVWDPYTKTNIDALEMIQRKAVRFIYSKYRATDSPTRLMKKHGISTLQIRRKMLRLKFLFLLKNNKLSLKPDSYLKPSIARLSRNRHHESLTPYYARTNIFKYSFFPRTITDWNQLPSSHIASLDAIQQTVC